MTLKTLTVSCLSVLLLAGCGSVTTPQANLPVAIASESAAVVPSQTAVAPQVTGAVSAAPDNKTAAVEANAAQPAGAIDPDAEAELQRALAGVPSEPTAGGARLAAGDGEQSVAEQLRLRAAMNSGAHGHNDPLPEDN